MSLRSKFNSLIGKTSPFSLEFVVSKANGAYLYDVHGDRFLDMISGIGVSHLGHSHPEILKAIHQQADQYLHTMVYGEHVQAPQVMLADLLVSILPPDLNSVFFHTSGTEAIEGAMKLAKKYTGRPHIVACKNAYHGSTYGAMSLMSDTSKTQPFQPILPGIKHINVNAIDELELIDEDTAAIVMEVIQAEAGIILPDPSFLKAVRDRCTTTSTLLIFDEIQSAFGRSGSLFAFLPYQIIPDILVLGKSLGGGLPLSVFITDKKIMESLADDPPLTHMTTFGGHPLSCAAGLASLQSILNSDLITESRAKAEFFEKQLDTSRIKMIRRPQGLWLALDLGNASKVQQVVASSMKKGLLVDWFLFNDHSIRIAPPLTISYPELDLAANIINQSFHSIS